MALWEIVRLKTIKPTPSQKVYLTNGLKNGAKQNKFSIFGALVGEYAKSIVL
jgi:hypothetical protein